MLLVGSFGGAGGAAAATGGGGGGGRLGNGGGGGGSVATSPKRCPIFVAPALMAGPIDSWASKRGPKIDAVTKNFSMLGGISSASSPHTAHSAVYSASLRGGGSAVSQASAPISGTPTCPWPNLATNLPILLASPSAAPCSAALSPISAAFARCAPSCGVERANAWSSLMACGLSAGAAGAAGAESWAALHQRA